MTGAKAMRLAMARLTTTPPVRGTRPSSRWPPMPRLDNIPALESLREELAVARRVVRVHVDHVRRDGLPCLRLPAGSRGHGRRDRTGRAWATRCSLRVTGCHGFCEQGPLVIIEPRVSSIAISARKTWPRSSPGPSRPARSSPSLLYTDPVSGKRSSWRAISPSTPLRNAA